MEAGVGDKETKRTKWRETRAATHSEQEQAKVNPRRENHFTAVTETTEWLGLRVSMQSGGRGEIAFSNCYSNIHLRYLHRLKFGPYMNALNTSFPCSVSDGELYSATVSDFSGSDPLIYKEPLRTDQSDSKHLNCECHSAITLYVQR